MTVTASIDPARLLEGQLAQASPDLLRELKLAFGPGGAASTTSGVPAPKTTVSRSATPVRRARRPITRSRRDFRAGMRLITNLL